MAEIKAYLRTLKIAGWVQLALFSVITLCVLYIAAVVMWAVVKTILAILLPVAIVAGISYGVWKLVK